MYMFQEWTETVFSKKGRFESIQQTILIEQFKTTEPVELPSWSGQTLQTFPFLKRTWQPLGPLLKVKLLVGENM